MFRPVLWFRSSVYSKYKSLIGSSRFQCGYNCVNMSSTTDKDQNSYRLVWVDLEMTGLDINSDHIIEMACIVSDGQLNVIAEGPNLVIHQPDEVLERMGEWCRDHHGQSGLTRAVRESKTSLQEAETQMLGFIGQHTPPGKCLLAGNSVHADKVFLDQFMPRFMKHLHYRIIDVSTVKELAKRWHPEAYHKAPSKPGSHRALDDIRESIKELEYYRKAIFK